jgi:hypothetical protein
VQGVDCARHLLCKVLTVQGIFICVLVSWGRGRVIEVSYTPWVFISLAVLHRGRLVCIADGVPWCGLGAV